MSSPQVVLRNLVKKIEDILTAKGVRVTVPHVYTRPDDGAELHLRWLHTKNRLQINLGHDYEEGDWANITSLCDSAHENSEHMPAAIVAQEITRLMPKCLEEQAAFEEECIHGAALLAAYMHDVGWYKTPAIVDPVEGVGPESEA